MASIARLEHNIASIIIVTLFGAGVNLMAVYILNSAYPPVVNGNLETSPVVGLLLLAGLPFLLSLIFTRFAPAGRIIPAFDIHVTSAALVLALTPLFNPLVETFYLLGLFMGATYSFQLGSRFVGYPVDPLEVYSRHLIVKEDYSVLKTIIEQPAVADGFGFDLDRTESNGSVLFMRETGRTFQLFMQIQKEDRPERTSIVHILGFTQTKYGMAKTDEAIEGVDTTYDHLRGVLDRCKPPIHHDDVSVPNLDRLTRDLLSGKVSGASFTLWSQSKFTWGLIGAVLLAMVAIPLYFFVVSDVNDALVTLAVDIVSLIPIVQTVRKRPRGPQK